MQASTLDRLAAFGRCASQLAGTVTTGAGERTPTSEIEKSSMTAENMVFERISVSAIQNQ
jgi:hypothetical protein